MSFRPERGSTQWRNPLSTREFNQLQNKFQLVTLPLHFDNKPATVPLVEAKGEKRAMAEKKLELPQGTLDLLILKAIELEPMHGWAISERLQQISRDVIQVQQGSLYPALHRLERRGWIKANWAISENSRRAKYYELTAKGRKQLAVEASDWNRLAAAVGEILGMA
ncbi:PadR family transcriptional regulator [Edaphobacter sp.]|uniref:PadR family transcriptional regulator n=1 Tax=Edaphobacter sp. TaxID=1934404 RepID=UPI00345C096A